MKKISVIITTYNSEATIQRVINSVKNQKGAGDHFELEIIVVDDCSSDNTVNIVKANGIEPLVNEKNSGGPNKGRNIGLRRATGDYICIADHDDEWSPEKIITLLPYTDKALIITSGYTIHDTKTGKKTLKINQAPDGKPYLLFTENESFVNLLLRNGKGKNTYLGSIFYSARLRHIFFEEEYGMSDFDWVLHLFHNRSSLEVCASLYTRYVDTTNLSLNESYRLKDYNFSVHFIEKYRKEYPLEVKKSLEKLNGTLARYYYLMDQMPKARKYFMKSGLTLKTVLYLLTSFAGSGLVKKKFNIFG